MQTLRDLRRRIKSIKSIKKITCALKMIAISKLRREQDKTQNSRPYVEEVKRLALEATSRCGDVEHPAFKLRKKVKSALLVVISQELGFCGSLSENMAREIKNFKTIMNDRQIDLSIWLFGKKGAKVFKKHQIPFERLEFEEITRLTQELLNRFVSGEVDQVMTAFTKFHSILHNKMTMEMFLPVWVKKDSQPKFSSNVDFIFEPEKMEVVNYLLTNMLEASLKQAIQESKTSELASRMLAMDKALVSADKMLGRLKQDYHRQRQSSITRELLDIVGGAEALK